MDRSPREVIGTSPEGVDKGYISIAAVEQDGFQRTGVSKCLAGLMQRSGGWKWRYADGKPHRQMPEELRKGLEGVERRTLKKNRKGPVRGPFRCKQRTLQHYTRSVLHMLIAHPLFGCHRGRSERAWHRQTG